MGRTVASLYATRASAGDRAIANQPLDPLTEEALAWLVRLHSGEAAERDWSDYHEWKAASEAQRGAAERAERLWQRLGPALKPTRSRKGGGIVAALILVVGLAGLSIATNIFGPPQAYFADERTSLGERRSVVLSDGSVVELDSGTSFDVDFTSSRRRLVLYTGQIYVSVRSDPARPFTVSAAGGDTRALGTAFDVRLMDEGARVLVTEHAVRVSYKVEADEATVDLRAGEQVAYTSAGLGPVQQADVRSATAWRRGQMIFDGLSLGHVVAEMARYRHGRIVITDNALNDLPVTGIFNSNDADALLDAVTQSLPVRVTRLPWLTLIQRDPSRPIEPFQHKN